MITDINQIDTSTKEGKYLMMTLAKLTSEGDGTKMTPYEMLDVITLMVKDIYGESELI